MLHKIYKFVSKHAKLFTVLLVFTVGVGLSGCQSLSMTGGGIDNPDSSSNEPIELSHNEQTKSVITNTYGENIGGRFSNQRANHKIDHYLRRIKNLNDFHVHIYSITLHHDLIHKISYNITFIPKGSTADEYKINEDE